MDRKQPEGYGINFNPSKFLFLALKVRLCSTNQIQYKYIVILLNYVGTLNNTNFQEHYLFRNLSRKLTYGRETSFFYFHNNTGCLGINVTDSNAYN